MVDCEVDGVLITNVTPNYTTGDGSGVYLLGADLVVSGGDIGGTASHGVYGLAAEGNHRSFTVKNGAKIHNNSGHCIYGRGIEYVDIAEDVDLNASEGNGFKGIQIDNTGGTDYNTGGGELKARCNISTSGDSAAIRSEDVASVDILARLRSDNPLQINPINVINATNVVLTNNVLTVKSGSGIPFYIATINTADNVIAWGNGGNTINATDNISYTNVTKITGVAPSLLDAAGWADSTAQTSYNQLLGLLRDAGILSI